MCASTNPWSGYVYGRHATMLCARRCQELGTSWLSCGGSRHLAATLCVCGARLHGRQQQSYCSICWCQGYTSVQSIVDAGLLAKVLIYTGDLFSIQDWLPSTSTMLVFLILHFRFGVLFRCYGEGRGEIETPPLLSVCHLWPGGPITACT
jgi:hypothetical protein